MWRLININKQNVIVNTGNAVLIACPHNSEYDGYCFWHTAKLVREGKHLNAISIGYTDSFTFRLRKYGSGTYNRNKVINEKEISVVEFEEAFSVMNENIFAPVVKNIYETHKPKKIEAVNRTADKSLIDNE